MNGTTRLDGGQSGFFGMSHKESYFTIATRKSVLARAQAALVASSLKKCHGIEVKVVPMAVEADTKPDARERRAVGMFTSTLEKALMSGEVDMAVHSIKDLPSLMPEALHIAATLKRGSPWDALVSDLSPDQISSSVGVSSPRRQAQWHRFMPGLKQVEIRGNVDTRIKKYQAGECGALVLAACGLDRIGFGEYTLLDDGENFLPAPCQGIIGVQILKSRRDLHQLLQHINHQETFLAMTMERRFVRMGAFSCQTPVSCLCQVKKGKLTFSAELFKRDTTFARADLEGTSQSIVDQALEMIKK